MILALPSVELRLQAEATPPVPTLELPEAPAPGQPVNTSDQTSVDPSTLGSDPPPSKTRSKRGTGLVRISPTARRLVADQQKRTEHPYFSPSDSDSPALALPVVSAEPAPVLQEQGLNPRPGVELVAGLEGSEIRPAPKHASNRAQEAPGGVLKAGVRSQEGNLRSDVLARLLLMRTHSGWPTHTRGCVWLRMPVAKGVAMGWCEGLFLWRALPEHSQQSLAGAFQVSYRAHSARYPFVATDGTVYPEIVYKAWLWCPADENGLLVGW